MNICRISLTCSQLKQLVHRTVTFRGEKDTLSIMVFADFVELKKIKETATYLSMSTSAFRAKKKSTTAGNLTNKGRQEIISKTHCWKTPANIFRIKLCNCNKKLTYYKTVYRFLTVVSMHAGAAENAPPDMVRKILVSWGYHWSYEVFKLHKSK